MKNQPVTLAIPKPCHENWQKMTPAEQGRFCQSCQKTVVDFSTKTDREVARFFEHGSANTCGRFRLDQLHRPLNAGHAASVGARLRAFGLVVPSLLLGSWASAQTDRNIKGKVACTKPPTTAVQPSPKLEIGDVAVLPPSAVLPEAPKPRILTGFVKEVGTGEALIGAAVTLKGTTLGTCADVDGRYRLEIPGDFQNPVLVFAYTGYPNLEMPLYEGQQEANGLLLPSHDASSLVGEIVIVRREETVYGILKEKLRGLFARKEEPQQRPKAPVPTAPVEAAVLPNQAPPLPVRPLPLQVEVFPNPFSNALNLRFQSSGAERLTIKLSDMNGRLLLSKTYEVQAGMQTLSLETDGIHLVPGQYFVEITDGRELRFAGVVVKA